MSEPTRCAICGARCYTPAGHPEQCPEHGDVALARMNLLNRLTPPFMTPSVKKVIAKLGPLGGSLFGTIIGHMVDLELTEEEITEYVSFLRNTIERMKISSPDLINDLVRRVKGAIRE